MTYYGSHIMSDLFHTASKVLYRAAELISDPAHWCKGIEAMDRDGNPRMPTSPNATAWCLIGAIKCAAGTGSEAREMAEEAVRAMLQDDSDTVQSLTRWNDNPYRLHGEVVALLESVADALDDLAHGRPPRPARII